MKRFGLVAVAGLALAACGSTHAHPAGAVPPPVTTTTAAPPTSAGPDLAAEYVAIVDPLNAATVALERSLNGARLADVPTLAAHYVMLSRSTTARLLRLGLTGQAAVDVRALVRDDAAVDADLESAPDAPSISEWQTQLRADGGRVRADAQAVRADIGAPAS